LWNQELTREKAKIFEFKELIDKIFRTKDLASGAVVLGRYARRAFISHLARAGIGAGSKMSVMGEKHNVYGQEQKQDSTD
jgi:hypothetical protein